MGIFQTLKDIRRMRQILNVLIKAGFGYIFQGTNIERKMVFKYTGKKIAKISAPMRIRIVIEELGGTFVKLGQLLSLRPDLVPIEIVEEFKTLQDNVKPFQTSEARAIIEQELGRKISTVFSFFSPEPIAAASIGQVYFAKLKDGTKVVVKVQRPDIKEKMLTDIDIMKRFAVSLQNTATFKGVNLVKIVEEFERYTHEELDYKLEAKNIDIFHENFNADHMVVIPSVHWKYTTSKILTMDYIDGIKLKDLKDTDKIDQKQIAKTSALFFIKQVFHFGFYHADPHPGNILVVGKKKIGLIDYGICGKMVPSMREKILPLFISLMTKDTNGVVDGILSIGLVPEDVSRDQLKMDVEEVFIDYYNTSFNQISLESSFHRLFAVSKKYHVSLPRAFVMLGKAITTAEGVGEMLDPEFNLTQVSRPFIEKEIKRKISPKEFALKSMNEVSKYANLFQSLPFQINAFVRKLNQGNLVIKTESQNMDHLSEEIRNSGVRRNYTSILVTFLILSTILLLQGKTSLAYTGYVIGILLLLIMPK